MAFPAAHPLEARIKAFIEEHVAPAEAVWLRQRGDPGTAGRWTVVPAVVEELKAKAKAAGLWNLFLPAVSGLTQLEYAPLAEVRDTISSPSSIPLPVVQDVAWLFCAAGPSVPSRAGLSAPMSHLLQSPVRWTLHML